jgi:hypothetical protein
MQHMPSLKANRSAASQENPRILWNPTVITTFTIACPYPSLSQFRSYQTVRPDPRKVFMFRNKDSFYSEDLSTPLPTPKLEDHPLSAVHNCLFNIPTATLHIGSRSSVHNLRTCHVVVTGTHLSQELYTVYIKKTENLYKALIDCIKCIIYQV